MNAHVVMAYCTGSPPIILLSDDLLVHVAKKLLSIPYIIRFASVYQQMKHAILAGMDSITRDFCGKDSYLQRLLLSEHVFPWKREQWMHYVKEMERQRRLPRMDTVQVESMEGVHVLCEVTRNGAPAQFYAGIPNWKTEHDVTDGVSCFGTTRGEVSNMVSILPVEERGFNSILENKDTVEHIYLVVNNRLHHWVTNFKQWVDEVAEDKEAAWLIDNENFLSVDVVNGRLGFFIWEGVCQTTSTNRFAYIMVESYVNPILESGYWSASFSNSELASKFNKHFKDMNNDESHFFSWMADDLHLGTYLKGRLLQSDLSEEFPPVDVESFDNDMHIIFNIDWCTEKVREDDLRLFGHGPTRRALLDLVTKRAIS